MENEFNDNQCDCGEPKSMKRLISFVILVLVVSSVLLYSSYKKQSSAVEGEPMVQGENVGQTEQNQDARIEATVAIDTGEARYEYRVEAPKEIDAFKLTKELSREKGFSFGFEESEMGAFVTEIHGMENDSQAETYWMFKVNGKLSEVGASSYIVANDDVVEWEYQESPSMEN